MSRSPLVIFCIAILAAPAAAQGKTGVLELDSKRVAMLYAMEGGGPSGAVVLEKSVDPFTKRHVASVKYEEIAVKLDLPLDKQLAAWVGDTCKGKVSRRDGAIAVADASVKTEHWRTEFTNATLVEVGWPALDAASKEAARLTLKFQPEVTRFKKGSGKAEAKFPEKPAPHLVASNFRLEITGLDCTRVVRIEPFAVRVGIPVKVTAPNLRLTIAESGAGSWIDWSDDFLVRGNNDASKEKNGTLIFLGPDLKQELGRVHLQGVGVFRVALPKIGAADGTRGLTVDLYCQRMEFSGPGVK